MSRLTEITAGLKGKIAGQKFLHKGTVASCVVHQGKGEAFTCRYAGGLIDIDAESAVAAAYGMSHVYSGLASGHFSEVVGKQAPLYPLRPIWVVGGEAYVLTEGVTCLLTPEILQFDTPEIQQQLAERILDMGYNALILGGIRSLENADPEPLLFSLAELAKTLKECGVKLILKPEIQPFCPHSPSDKENTTELLRILQESIPDLYAIYWESNLLHPKYKQGREAKEALLYDLVQEEVKVIEESLQPGVSLIFYIPARNGKDGDKQADWLQGLCDDVGDLTTISFSSVAGAPTEDHRPLHAVWESLRSSPDISHTKLMPVANVGAVSQGEGLWPTIPIDLLSQVFERCYRHSFAGVVAMTPCIPKSEGLLGCALWTAGHLMWRKQTPELLMETWFRAFRSDLNFSKFRETLRELRHIVVKISLLKELAVNVDYADEVRLLSQSLLAHLDLIQVTFDKDEKMCLKSAKQPSFYDYFQYFLRDARRLIFSAMERANLSTSGYVKEHDNKESFWTSTDHNGMQNIQSQMNIVFLQQPNTGAPGSRMHQIWKERSFGE